jgi:large subunit ribosomal protein L19
VNRAKLYYLRGKVGRKARVRERRYGPGSAAAAAPIERTLEAAEEPPAAAEQAEVETEAPAEAEPLTAEAEETVEADAAEGEVDAEVDAEEAETARSEA